MSILLRFVNMIACAVLLTSCVTVMTAANKEGIQENSGRRTIGSVFDDNTIETTIIVNLHADDDRFADAHINVTSFNGVVLLTGQVQDRDLKNLATKVATTPSQVKTVHNELEISPPISLLTRSADALLSTKVKALMLADPTVSGMRIKVVAEHGVIYLMGLLTHNEAELASELASQASGVTKVIRAFEYID
jgi:osmotically-inducible protein OsmY